MIGNNGIGKNPQPLDLDFYRISLFEVNRRLTCESDARRSARSHDVAGFESDISRQKFDQFGDTEDHLRGVGILHGLTIKAKLYRKILWVGYLVGRGDKFANRRKCLA